MLIVLLVTVVPGTDSWFCDYDSIVEMEKKKRTERWMGWVYNPKGCLLLL
jgi:hypothetical protein